LKALITSQLNDLDVIVNIDREVFGNESRRKYIRIAIEEERYLIILKNDLKE
jgi:hypothetical protein